LSACGSIGGLLGGLPGASVAGRLLAFGNSPQFNALSDLLQPPQTPFEGEINAPFTPLADNKVIQDAELPSPITPLAVAQRDGHQAEAALGPDGRLYFTEKDTGRVRVFNPTTVTLEPDVLLDLAVNTSGTRGLIGIAFSTDGTRIYFTYNTSTTGDDSGTEP